MGSIEPHKMDRLGITHYFNLLGKKIRNINKLFQGRFRSVLELFRRRKLKYFRLLYEDSQLLSMIEETTLKISTSASILSKIVLYQIFYAGPGLVW